MKNIFTLPLLSCLTLSVAYGGNQEKNKTTWKLKKSFREKKSFRKKNFFSKKIKINNYLLKEISKNFTNHYIKNDYFYNALPINLTKDIASLVDFTDLKNEINDRYKKEKKNHYYDKYPNLKKNIKTIKKVSEPMVTKYLNKDELEKKINDIKNLEIEIFNIEEKVEEFEELKVVDLENIHLATEEFKKKLEEENFTKFTKENFKKEDLEKKLMDIKILYTKEKIIKKKRDEKIAGIKQKQEKLIFFSDMFSITIDSTVKEKTKFKKILDTIDNLKEKSKDNEGQLFFGQIKNDIQSENDKIQLFFEQIKNDIHYNKEVMVENRNFFYSYDSLIDALEDIYTQGKFTPRKIKKLSLADFFKELTNIVKKIKEKNKIKENTNKQCEVKNPQNIQEDFENISSFMHDVKSFFEFCHSLYLLQNFIEEQLKLNEKKNKTQQVTQKTFKTFDEKRQEISDLFEKFSYISDDLHISFGYNNQGNDNLNKTFNYFLRNLLGFMILHSNSLYAEEKEKIYPSKDSSKDSSDPNYDLSLSFKMFSHFLVLQFPFFIQNEEGTVKKYIDKKIYQEEIELIYGKKYGKRTNDANIVDSEAESLLKEKLESRGAIKTIRAHIALCSMINGYQPTKNILNNLNPDDFTYHLTDYFGSLLLHCKMMHIMTCFYQLRTSTFSKKSSSDHSNIEQSFLFELKNQFINNENRFMKKEKTLQEREEIENIHSENDQEKYQIIQRIENFNIKSSQESLNSLEDNLFFSKYKNKMKEDKDEMKEESVDTKLIDTPMKIVSDDEFSLSPMTKNDKDFQLQQNPPKFSQEKQKENIIIKFFFENVIHLNNKDYLKKIKTSFLKKIYEEIVKLKNMLKSDIFENIDEGINQNDSEETILAQKAENTKKIFSTRKKVELIGYFYNENVKNPNKKRHPEAIEFYINTIDTFEAIFKDIMDKKNSE